MVIYGLENQSMEIDSIIQESGFTLSDLQGSCRKSELVAMRVYLARLLKSQGVHEKTIAKWLNKDRTTIIFYLRYYKETEYYKNIMKEITKDKREAEAIISAMLTDFAVKHNLTDLDVSIELYVEEKITDVSFIIDLK